MNYEKMPTTKTGEKLAGILDEQISLMPSLRRKPFLVWLNNHKGVQEQGGMTCLSDARVKVYVTEYLVSMDWILVSDINFEDKVFYDKKIRPFFTEWADMMNGKDRETASAFILSKVMHSL
jgi:hypothetical protein